MIIVLDNLRSAHNVGSIIRTCDALGIKEIHFCGITPGPGDKRVKKTALGAEKNIIAKERIDTYSDLEGLKKDGYRVIGLEITKNARNLGELKENGQIVLVVGNEVSGLSEETQRQCHLITQIPMRGIKESMNVSVAFGIAAYIITNGP
jgi:tRNA G18 (ribose-2'-O)-methylase SpoU